MRLALVSHKICWKSAESPSGYATDGGFPSQVEAISELFDETRVLVPCLSSSVPKGLSPLTGNNLHIVPLDVPSGENLRRKLNMLPWAIKNSSVIWRETRKADAIHAPIPGDVGTIGMLLAMLLRKPLFVRHCGNWMVQKTLAEDFWKWSMERFAGGRNVMFATGGDSVSPSETNPNIKWIFSTSLRQHDLNDSVTRELPGDGAVRLITACRLEEKKGVDGVIESMPLILEKFPKAFLDVVGDGSLLPKLREQVRRLGIKDKVTFHGKVTPSKVVELMKASHVFCFPTSASEGFPKVVLEAMASGLPVITTKVSVLPELVGGSGCGILLDAPTAGNLADAVKTICSDPVAYRQISSNTIKTASQYSLENWRDFIGENLRKAWNVESLSSAQ